jgi:hypothetical protein
LLSHGQWFSLGTPASSTTKTGRHDIAEILLKVALNTKNKNKTSYKTLYMFWKESSKDHSLGIQSTSSQRKQN